MPGLPLVTSGLTLNAPGDTALPTCAICTDKLGEHGYIGHVTAGAAEDHAFHDKCLARWQKHLGNGPLTCPNCRKQLQKRNITQITPPAAPTRPATRLVPRAPAPYSLNTTQRQQPATRYTRRVTGNRPFGTRSFTTRLPRTTFRTPPPPPPPPPRRPYTPRLPCYLLLPAAITRCTRIPLPVTTALTYGIATIAITVGIIALGILFSEFLLAAIILGSTVFACGAVVSVVFSILSANYNAYR